MGSGTVLVSRRCQSLWFALVSQQCYTCLGPSVEQVQRRDGGFLWFLDLRFGQFDPAHGNHATDGKVCRNTAYTQPERPVEAVIQDNEHEEVLPIIGHPLGQTVVPHGCQETQHGQGTEKSWEQRGEKSGKGNREVK